MAEVEYYQGALTGEQIDALPNLLGNRNLLDNWYFANAVNQIGESEYSGIGYGIDRWYTRHSVGVVNKSTGFVKFSTTSGYAEFIQYLENAMPSGEYTFSALVRNVSSNTGTNAARMRIYDAVGNIIGNAVITDSQAGDYRLVSVTGTGSPAEVRFMLSSTGGYIELIAVKLESGNVQTLAHLESGVYKINNIPNYQQELAICQRHMVAVKRGGVVSSYGFGFMYSASEARITVPTPVTMRAVPTLRLLGSSGAISDIGIVQGGSEATASSFGNVYLSPIGVAFVVNITGSGHQGYAAVMKPKNTNLAGILLDANIYPS